MIQFKVRVITLILVLLFLNGCGIVDIPQPIPPNGDDEDQTPTIFDPGPVKGGELSIAIPTPDSFNPLLTKSRDTMNFLSMIFDSIVEYDEQIKPQPSLASSWEVLDDGKLWVFHIRKDIEWHNGQPLTAEDVLFTFEAIQSGRLNSFYEHHILQNPNIIKSGLKDGDPYTFYIQLAKPSATVLDWMVFPVISQAVYRTIEGILEGRKDLSNIPLGTGPYKMDTAYIDEQNQIILVRNENWWKGEPYIDTIKGKIYTNNEEARAAFNDKKVDVVDTSAVYANIFLSSEDVTLNRYSTQNYEFLAFNSDSSLFADKNIRSAIAYAIDRKEIISKVFLNNAEAVDVPISSTSWLYDTRLRKYDYDIELAKRLLKESGWEDHNGDGFFEKVVNGKNIELSFTILTNSDNDLRRESLFLISKQLELVGIKVHTKSVKWNELKDEYMAEREYDAILTGYYLDYAHDLTFAFHSNEVGVDTNNFMGYSSAELDNLLINAKRAYNDQERLEIYREIQEHLVENLPVISLYFRTGSLMSNKKIRGIKGPIDISVYRNISEWYIVEPITQTG